MAAVDRLAEIAGIVALADPDLAGGAFAGLSLYVYMAARIFPIWLALPLLILLLADSRRGLRLRQIVAFFASLIIVALPLAIFYLSNLDVLTDRLEQLAPGRTRRRCGKVHYCICKCFSCAAIRCCAQPVSGRPFFDPVEWFAADRRDRCGAVAAAAGSLAVGADGGRVRAALAAVDYSQHLSGQWLATESDALGGDGAADLLPARARCVDIITAA
ncbi:MAG: hypothetical protein U0528_05305 [Anaerolineae bacterium]